MLKRTLLVLAGACTLFFTFGFPAFSSAAPDPASSRSVTVVPPSFELYANPGDTVSDKIRVRNDSTLDMTYSILVEDFKAVGEEGNVGLMDNQTNTTYSLAKWVFPEPKSFTLSAGQEKEIPFSINVPKNAEPGGHYGSVLIKSGGSGNVSNGAAISSRVGSLILLRVSGNVKEEASVVSFKADKSYYEKGPVNLTLRVKDTGNNHIKPKGTIVITNIFGRKVDEIDLAGLNVLPGAIRKMPTDWKPKGLAASRYTATLVANYGTTGNNSLSASTSFIIFPKYLIVLIIVIIAALVGMFSGRKKLKKIIHNLTKS